MSTVLIIEDDPLLGATLRLILEAEGHRTILAPGGRPGLQAASEEDADVVLLDLSMPEMDGWEVIAEIRRDPALAGLPVAAYTSQALDRSERERLLDAGFDVYLSKAAPAREVLATVRRLAERSARVTAFPRAG